MSAAENLKRQYQEALAAKRAAMEAEAQREEAARRAQLEQAEAAIFTWLAPFIPEGVMIEWKIDQSQLGNRLSGYFMADGENKRYLMDFVVHTHDDELEVRVKTGHNWRQADPSRLAEYIGAEIEYQDALIEEEAEKEAEEHARIAREAEEHAKWQAEAARLLTETAARAQAAEAARSQAAADQAARRAEKLARKVAEAEAIAAAQAKHLVNPSGLALDDIDRWANQAIESATDAGARLPAVEQLRTEISIYERQLKEAQVAATWGTNGANETERKNAAARALAADPEVKRLQAALDQMARQLAVIEPEYKAVAMKSGAWRAVAELYAGWLQSLR